MLDIDQQTHRDLRAQEKADNRIRKQKQKYYGYRGVKPSWVGQEYYNVTLVTENTVSWMKSRKTKPKTFHPAVVIEKELPTGLPELLPSYVSWGMRFLDPYIHLAVAEARGNSKNIHPERIHEALTPSYADVDTIEAPNSLARVPEDLNKIMSKFPSDARWKLKVRTWTKKDSFKNKDFFTGGPDIRHSRSRRFRERRCQKWNLRSLQRNTKAGEPFRDEVDNRQFYQVIDQCEEYDALRETRPGELRDLELYTVSYAYMEGHCEGPCRWDEYTTYDPRWYVDDDDGSDLDYNSSEYIDDDTVEMDHDEWHELQRDLAMQADMEPARWNELRHAIASSYYPERYAWGPPDPYFEPLLPEHAYTVRFVPSMKEYGKRCICTPTPSVSDTEEELPTCYDDGFWDDFASSLNSSAVIVASYGGGGEDDSFSDFDNMSDLAEAIVDGEWDVLSYGSTPLFS